MNKTIDGTLTTYSNSRRVLLGLVLPLPALLLVNHMMELSVDWLPVVVTSMFAIGGVALGLTGEQLTLDMATRQGVYKTVFAGIQKRTRTFSFDDVVGCLMLDPIAQRYDHGRQRSTHERIFHVAILYRELSGKLADQIEVGTYSDEQEAMAEATALVKSLGGQIYFAKDLEGLLTGISESGPDHAS